MNCANAIGFAGFGVTMWVVPILFPGWFPHFAVDGSSTRALWLEIMGAVQSIIGFGFLALHWRTVVASLVQRLPQPRGILLADPPMPTPLAPRLPLVFVDFARDLVVSDAGAAEPSLWHLAATSRGPLVRDVAIQWAEIGRISAAEARVTNLVGRSADVVRQAA